jgi:DNA-binding LacI/PurR family transcriptional regulator
MKKIRIEDVAKAAGVSTTAVSFAFNNPERLNEQTVKRILQIADQLGYSPNPHARALLTKSVGAIGILIPQSLPAVFANPFFAAFHEGIGGVCEENRLSLMVISPAVGSLAAASAKAPVDGLIVVGLDESHPEIEVLRRRKMPFVIVDGDAVGAPSVNVDDQHGAWLAADYLLRHGHRDILCLVFERDFSATHDGKSYGVGLRRLEGYKRAFADHAVAWSESYLIPTAASISAGMEAFHTIWNKADPRPTALLAVADIMAIGVIHAAMNAGVRVPDGLAIIGFDDIPQAMWTYPPLTTVHQPAAEKGEIAAQMLLSLIAGEPLSKMHILLPTELVIRQST